MRKLKCFFSRRASYVLLLLVICSELVIAQNQIENNNSGKEIYSAFDDTTFINHYLDTGDKYQLLNEDSAICYYTKALDITERSLQDSYSNDNSEELQNTLLLKKAVAFDKIGLMYYYQCQYNKSIDYFEKALTLSKELENNKMIAVLYNRLGYTYRQQNIYTKALEYFAKSLEKYEILNDQEKMASVYNGIGTIYYRQGKYEKAIKQYEKSLKIYDEYGNEYEMASLYNNISLVYYEIENFEKAIYYFEKALYIYKKLDDQKRVCVIYNNLGATFIEQGNNKKGMEYYSKSLESAKILKDSLTIANTLSNIAGIYIDMNNTSKALEYVTESLEINQAIKNKPGISITLSNISFLYNKQNNHYKAVEYALQALQVAREIGALAQEKEASLNLSDAYKGLNDFENALKYMKLNNRLKDSLLNEENSNAINEFITKYETEKKLQEYELLLKEHEIQDYKLSKSKQVVIIIVGILFLTISIFILIYRQHKNKNSIIELELGQKLYRVQINPRFISDSLSLLKEKILNDTPMSACSFLADFAKFMRLILENSDERFISLERELQTINHYFNLQNQALDNKLSFSFSTSEEIDSKDWIVPPMLMQPFIVFTVEKIIKQDSREGNICVRIIDKEECIIFNVEFLSDSPINLLKNDNNVYNLIKERLNHINKLNKNKLKLSFNEFSCEENISFTSKMSVNIPYDLNV